MTVAPYDGPPEPDDTEPEPADLPAERAMLAAVLYVASTDTAAAHLLVDDLAALVAPADLWGTAHERIWAAMIEATAVAEPLHPAALATRLASTSAPARLAALDLPNLLTLTVPSGAAPHHARAIAVCAQRRRLIRAGQQLTARALSATYDPGVDLPAALAAVEAAGGVTKGAQVSAGELLPEVMDRIESPEEVTGLPTGLNDLDVLYAGFGAGQLVVIGARPAVGKTTLGLGFARQTAIRLGERTLVLSLEMSSVENGQRILAAQAGVDLGRIIRGTCDERDWDLIAKAADAIRAAPLLIDDTPGIGLAQIQAACRREMRRGLRVLVVDHLGLMTMARAESRQVAVDAAARGLKNLAKELGITVILLVQLNRDLERRADKRPTMADIRESGAIEAHADLILLLHREELHHPTAALVRSGEIDVVIAKHRNGPTSTIACSFQGHHARIVSMANWAERT